MAEDAHKSALGQDLEKTVEDLTKELSRFINEAGADGREELRDYAVSLLQGETETTQTEASAREDAARPAPFSPVALSIPFLIIGIILLPLFAPIGLLMLFLATVMGIGGWLALMFSKKNKRTPPHH